MKWILSQLLLLLCFVSLLKAQNQVSGLVQDRISRKAINHVDVFNLNTKEQTATNEKGEYKIKAVLNDLLVFRIPGYRIDTVLLINLDLQRRYLEKETNTLNTVTISGEIDSKAQHAQVYNKANAVLLTKGRGLLFYPSSYFSKEGKAARKLKRMLKQDPSAIKIDQRFNPKTVTAILPTLKQPELDAFMLLYRPDLDFVLKADADDFKFYLYDAYQKFKLLPPEKRVLPSLKLEEHD